MKLPPTTSVAPKDIHIDPANKRLDLVLEPLKLSIAQHGILQPPGLRHDPGRGCYYPIWGNRRVRCAQELNLAEIPGFVFECDLSPAEIAVYRAIENEQRLDLKPSERGRTYQELMELRQISAKEVAELLSLSPPTISRHLAILNHPSDILAMIDAGVIPLSTGVCLARLPDEELRRDLVRQLRDGQCSRVQVEEAVAGLVSGKAKARPERLVCQCGADQVTVLGPGLTVERLLRALARVTRATRQAKLQGLDLAGLQMLLKENEQ